MPANLPPQFHEAEGEYRAATTRQAKIAALERMLAVMPHHKGTDHLRADLRTRLAKLTQEAERDRAAGGRTDPYAVRKDGAGQAVLVGLPNAGKSALLQALTGAPAKVADYPFTTQTPQPAMMPFEDIQVQIVDLPPIVPGDTPGPLRGLLRQADLLLLVASFAPDPLAELATLLAELTALHLAAIPSVGPPADEGLLVAKKALVVANKCDLDSSSETAQLVALEYSDRLPCVAVSTQTGAGLGELRRRIVAALDIVRVYTKPPGRPADRERPFVLARGTTVEDLADAIHRDVRGKLKYAVLWSPHRPAIRVARHYVLEDRDIIELHTS